MACHFRLSLLLRASAHPWLRFSADVVPYIRDRIGVMVHPWSRPEIEAEQFSRRKECL